MTATEADHRLPIADRAQVWRSITATIGADRTAFTVVLALYFAAAAAGAAIPVLLGLSIDGITTGWSTARTDLLCAGVAACVALQFLLIRFGRRSGYRLGERAAARLRESCVERTLGLPLDEVERAGAGDLSTRCGGDLNAVAEMYRRTGPSIVIAVIEAAVILGFAVAVQPVLGLLCLTSVPVLLLGMRYYLRRSSAVFLAERAAAGDIAESLSSSLQGSRTVASYGMEAEREEEARTNARVHYRRLLDILRLQTRFFPTIDLAFLVPIVLTVVVGGVWYLNGGALSAGTIVAVAMLGIRLERPLKGIMLFINGFQEGLAALARIEGISSRPVAERTASPHDSEVRLQSVRFGYTDDVDIFRDLTLRIPSGERLAVVGPSGAGKSTIARLIAGIDRPRSGEVLLGAVPATEIPLEALRRRVVLVTQEHHVFSATLRENLGLAVPEADDERLLAALEAVGAKWAFELEEGLDTMLGEQHTVLGESEAQQIALARVMLAEPDIVILDESTAGVDAGSRGEVEAALAAAFERCTVIAIVHQLQAAEVADRVVVVDQGHIVEAGSHRRLLEQRGPYFELWSAWRTGGFGDERSRDELRPDASEACPAGPDPSRGTCNPLP